jgi:surfactin synthase thioesterase subunit
LFCFAHAGGGAAAFSGWDRGLGPEVEVFTGADDPLVSVGQAHAWRRLTRHGCRLRVFPGGHFYLLDGAARLHTAIRNDLGVRQGLGGAVAVPAESA